MKKTSSFLTILTVAALTFTGCASAPVNQAITQPSAKHITDVEARVSASGIVMDPVTGQNTLGHKVAYISVLTVPVSFFQTSNGLACSYPDVAMSFEVAGKNSLFGAAGMTRTLATGHGVDSLLGGQHVPVNGAFYGTNNVIVYQPPTTVANPVPFTTSMAGTNQVQKPIIVVP